MPRYLKSRARQTFENEIGAVLRTVRQAFSANCPAPEVRVFVLSNAMLMGSAKLESYVEDLVSDWVTRVNAARLNSHAIPTALRSHFFSQQSVTASYQRFAVYGDEHALNTRVVGLLNSHQSRFLIDGQPLPLLNSGWILHERKYPSPDNWVVLFRRLGIAQVFHLLNAEAGRDVKLILTSYNDLRSALAHEGIPPGLSAQDIRLRLSDIGKLVSWLDRVFFRSLGRAGGIDVWTA